ncbi:MAG: hypothetical protein HFI90_00555 [Clostridia bacterium]|nr:hypothetical protein [Clostridia bacterium]
MKKFSLLLSICMLLVLFTLPAGAAELISQTETRQTVTSGVELIELKRMTTDGWQNVHIVQADLTNPKLSLSMIYPKSGAGTLQNVAQMADSYGAVAAINSDFFDSKGGGKGSSIGYNAVGGETISTPPIDAEFASIGLDVMGNVLLEHFNHYIEITAPDGTKEYAQHVNKYNVLGGTTIYTPAWGKQSLGASGTKVEVVVENDVVTDIRLDKPAVDIPQNGYVIYGDITQTNFLTMKLQVGDKISCDVVIGPNNDMDVAIGGSTMLVKNGVRTAITLNSPGRAPRSAIGFDATGKQVYFIAVDGRGADESIGMTLNELANFCLDLKLFNALNLDGGGSTQLAVKFKRTDTSTVVNHASQYPYRAVSSAAAILTTAQRGVLESISATAYQDNVFVGTRAGIDVLGEDELGYDMEIDSSQVKLSFSGVKGRLDGNSFFPEEPGTATITAEYQGKTATMKLRAIEGPARIVLSPNYMNITSNAVYPLAITGYSADGYSAPINPADAVLDCPNDLIALDWGGVRSLGSGIATATVSIGSASAMLYVNTMGTSSIAPESKYTDGFESSNGTALPYPENVICTYEISGEQAHSGSYSGKLAYDFRQEIEGVQSAAMEFSNPPTIANQNSKIRLWVHAASYNQQWLRVMLRDANGTVHRLSLADSLTFDGWRQLEMNIPSDVALPAQLTRIYLVQDDTRLQNAGIVYFDDLEILGGVPSGTTTSGDPIYGNLPVQPINYFGGLASTNTLMEGIARRQLSAAITQPAFLLDSAEPFGNLSVFTNMHKSVSGGVTTLELQNNSSGILEVNPEGWKWLLAEAEQISTPAAVLALSSPLNFTNQDESDLFYSTLAKLTNKGVQVFVVWKNGHTSINTVDGVRYISLAAFTPSAADHRNIADILQVYTSGTSVKYQIDQHALWRYE